MKTKDKQDDKEADFQFSQLDTTLLDFEKDKEGSAGAEQARKMPTAGVEKKTRGAKQQQKKSSCASNNMNDALGTGEISFAELKKPHKSINEKVRQKLDGVGEEPDNSLPESGTNINFSKHLDNLKKRTEVDLPFTLTQVEDAMYISQSRVVTLEYHYYQTECQYSYLNRLNEHWVEEEGKLMLMNTEQNTRVVNQLGTQNYQTDEEKMARNISQFERNQMVNLQTDNIDILDKMRRLEKRDFMTIRGCAHVSKNKVQSIDRLLRTSIQRQMTQGANQSEDDMLVCPVVAVYKITNDGLMQRSNEVECKMGGHFQISGNGNMVLTRSMNKKLISLCSFDQQPMIDGQFFQLDAWNVKKLKQITIRLELTASINQYYFENISSFAKLESVTFVHNNEYVQLVYFEKRNRQFKETQSYGNDIIEKMKNNQVQSRAKDREQADNFQKSKEPRKARKYVIFSARTGKIAFEYGGVKQPLAVEVNEHPEPVKLYELGMLMDENADSKISCMHIYVAGDFLSEEQKKENMIFKWCLCELTIDLNDEWFEQTQQQIQDDITEMIKNIPYMYSSNDEDVKQEMLPKIKMVNLKLEGHEEEKVGKHVPQYRFFLYDQSNIEHQLFDWEMNISVAANKNRSQFAIINSPQEGGNIQRPSTYYVNGRAFQTDVNYKQVPYYVKMPPDCRIEHGRNSHIKDELFYNLYNTKQQGQANKTFCLRLLEQNSAKRVIPFEIKIQQSISKFDQWLQFKKRLQDTYIADIFQTISVQQDDQFAILQTRVPISYFGSVPNQFETLIRKTNMFQMQQASHPFFAYNLGDKKLVITNIDKQKNQKARAYILNMEENEQFIGFADFNSFDEIGFYPLDLKIECCSNFLYMTKQIDKNGVSRNRLKLLLLDPFCKILEAVLFTSSTYFDNSLLNQSDMVLKSIIQNNKKNKNDINFSTYIWSQIPNNLVRSKMMIQKTSNIKMGEDSDQNDEADLKHKKATADDLKKNHVCENIPFISDSKGFIYYVQIEQGEYKIMEGNPKDPYLKNHQCIFRIKIHNCLAFDYENGAFYIMDESHTTRKLTRNENQRLLTVDCETTLKEIQKLDYTPKGFDKFILREKYSVYQSKLFYFYELDKNEFPQGILEAENLIESDSGFEFQSGPYQFSGSYRFYEIYKGHGFTSFARIHLLPDKTQRTLVNDFQNQVDMSTFLENGNILIKIRARYMIYTQDGNFINEVKFDDTNLGKINRKNKYDDSDSDYHHEVTIKSLKEHLARWQEKHKDSQEKKESSKETIYDFNGLVYSIHEDEDDEQEQDDSNQVNLIQFSNNNKYFLFYKKSKCQLVLYQLSELNQNFSFKAVYMVDVEDCLLFQKLYKERYVDLMAYYEKNQNQVIIDNEGRIKLSCVIQNRQNGEERDHEDYDKSECIIAIFQHLQEPNLSGWMQQQHRSVCYNFCEEFYFPSDAQDKKDWLIKKQKNEVMQNINSVRINQSRLPHMLRDYSEYDNLLRDLRNLEMMNIDFIHSNVYFQNLVVIQQGHYLTFGRLQKKKVIERRNLTFGTEFDLHYEFENIEHSGVNKTIQNLSYYFHKGSHSKMKTMSCDFDHTVAILKVIETSKMDCLQIVAKDYSSNLILVLTWDFNLNCELSCYQIKDSSIYRNAIGNHIFKGLKNKMNYFQDKNYFIDLEHNIPIKQKNVDQGLDSQISYSQQVRNLGEFYNSKKSNYLNDKQLGIEKASCMYYTLSRMDIMLWKNITENGGTRQIISQSVELDDFNVTFGGTSLFHYFARSSSILEFVLGLINDKKQIKGELSETEMTLPMHILNPDRDGKNAVYWSVQQQSPKSFEIMIEMLKPFQNLCVSKMILGTLVKVIKHQQQNVIDFLGDNLYTPPQMDVEFFVNWDDSFDEISFPSHTSIISKTLLDEHLKEKISDYKCIEDINSQQQKKTQSENPNESGIFRCIKNMFAQDRQLEKKEETQEDECKCSGRIGESQLEMLLDKESERSSNSKQNARAGKPSEAEKPPQRVQIEALDIDWLFTNNNSKRLIELLVDDDANPNILIEKQIKVIIKLLWEIYQPQIIKKIFLPYAINLILLGILTGYIVDDYFVYREQLMFFPHDQKLLQWNFWVAFRAYVFTLICILAWMFFAVQEGKQIIKQKFGYFKDLWNVCDIISLVFNYWFLMMFFVDLIYKEGYFKKDFVENVGSWVMFWMWIKVFYWFRLFESYATYIKLIVQTITDMSYFLMMVLIIILSFANFMYVADQDLQGEVVDGKQLKYMHRNYVGKTYKDDLGAINSIISVYMLGALGQFSQQSYIQGGMHYSASFMFLLATFFIAVVFMNMLIAIMSDTFGDVMSNNEINTVQEQVIMISDYKWLIDLDRHFMGYKYVIRVSPFGAGSTEESNIYQENLNDACYHTSKKIEINNYKQLKRIDFIESNTRFQLNHQLDNLKIMMQKLKDIDVRARLKEEQELEHKNAILKKEKEEVIYEKLTKYINTNFLQYKQMPQQDYGNMSLLEQSLRKHLKERVKAIIRELHTEHLDRNAVAAIMNALVEDKDQITDQNIDDVCQLLNSNESISSARDFGQMIKKMFANEIEINDERIREIALDLLETIDIDKSGSIEYNEFYEFFSKLDDLEVNQEIMENIFNSFDSNKQGSISIEEFARAIKDSLQLHNEKGAEDKTSDDSDSQTDY